jgi:serine/threonine-protein kinase RsbW
VVDRYADRLEIEIADEGQGFTESDVPDPLSEENLLGQSGRGLLMVRAFMDTLEMRKREPQGTIVRLVKRRPSVPR